MELPPFIIQKSEKWFYNTKSKRYIHTDNLEKALKRHKALKTGNKAIIKQKVAYRKNVRDAKRRWENEY